MLRLSLCVATYRLQAHEERVSVLTTGRRLVAGRALGLGLTFAGLALAFGAPSAGASTRCGSFLANHGAYVVAAYRDGPLTCRAALRVVKEFRLYLRITGTSEPWGLRRFPGWRCSEGAGGGACIKGRQVASWGVRDAPEFRSCPVPDTDTRYIRVRRTSCAVARRVLRRPHGTPGWWCRDLARSPNEGFPVACYHAGTGSSAPTTTTAAYDRGRGQQRRGASRAACVTALAALAAL